MELERTSGCQVAPAASGSSSHVPGSVPEDGLHDTSYSRSLRTPHLPRHRGNSGWHSVAWTNCLVINLARRSLEPGWRSKSRFWKLVLHLGPRLQRRFADGANKFRYFLGTQKDMALFPDGRGSSGKISVLFSGMIRPCDLCPFVHPEPTFPVKNPHIGFVSKCTQKSDC